MQRESAVKDGVIGVVETVEVVDVEVWGSTYAVRATKVASETQPGAAPAEMAKMEEERRETLKAKRRPMTSAPAKKALLSTDGMPAVEC